MFDSDIFQPPSIKSKQNHTDVESQQVHTGKTQLLPGDTAFLAWKIENRHMRGGEADWWELGSGTAHMAKVKTRGSCQERQLIKR